MLLRYSILALLEGAPRHGYELKRRYDVCFGAYRPVRFGQIYSTLGRLRRDGFVELTGVEAGGGPDRKVYLITPAGVLALEGWLRDSRLRPPLGRSVLFTKVMVALLTGHSAADVLDAVRKEHLSLMRSITRRKRQAGLFDSMALDLELFHLEADLRWIEFAGQRVERLREEILERV